MVGQPPVAPEIRDKFGSAGWKRQARVEEGLVDRKRRVDRSASAMDDCRAWEREMDEPGPEEVERHLVGDPRRLRPDLAQHAKILGRRLAEERRFGPRRAGPVPRGAALVPEIPLAAGADLGMAGDDLFDEGRAGP